jgi:tape measure domain-containing protein
MEGGELRMSNSIDTRVVEMKFDNAQFERGVASTLKSLAGLKQASKLEGATSGIDNLHKGLSRIPAGIGSIANNVQSIASRFSTMGIVGVTALANIATQAVSTGAAMLKSFSLDPVMAGFSEYELKLGSIQTILANTAKDNTTLAQVAASLDQLNHYADKTIYNFGEMTKNIGLFTNAGIKLEDATSMIKGFSNEAAASGTSAEGAAGAAYQLSQALSAGKITLMDWRSLQNVGMGNANMKRGILEIATAMGTLEKKGVKAGDIQKDFNGTLEKGWLTADVMSTYLRIMAGDMTAAQMKSIGLSATQIAGFAKQQKTAEDAATKVRTFTQLVGTLKEAVGSGWSQTFETLFGNFDEATVLFTNVNNVIGGFVQATSNARNKVLDDWKALGGRTQLIKGISNAFNALVSVIKPIKDAFREIFPPVTGKQLFALTKSLTEFTSHLKIGADTAKNLKRTFAGVFAIFSIAISVLKGLGTVVKTVFSAFSGGSGGLLEFTGNIGDWLVALDKAIKKGEGFHNFFVGLGKVLLLPIKGIQLLIGFIKDLLDGVDKVGSAGLDRLGARFSPLEKIGAVISKIWSNLIDILGDAFKAFLPLSDKFADFFSHLGTMISSAFSTGDFNKVLDGINTGLLAGLVLLFRKFVNGGLKVDFGGSALDNLKDALDGLTGTLGAMQANLKANALLKIAGAIGILAISVVALAMVDPKRLTSAMAGITVMFGQLVAATALLDKVTSGTSFIKLPFIAASLIALAIAIDLLAIAVGKLSRLSWEELAKGLTGVAVLLTSLALFTKFSAVDSASGLSLILLAGAINLLVKAVEDFGDMKWSEIAKGLTGVAVMLTALALFTKFSAANKGAVAQGVGLVLLAAAIKILADAVEEMGKLTWGEIAKGLVTMAGGLIAMGAALLLVPPSSILSAAAIFVVAASLGKIGDAVKQMGGLSWGEIARGLTTLAGALTLISVAIGLLPPTSLLSAAAIFVVAASLGKIAEALGKMGGMTWSEIAKGLVTLAGALTIISVAMIAMTEALPGAAAVLVVAAALKLLAPVLITFGNMKWSEIAKGLTMLAGVFLVLGVAGLVLTPLVPTLIALGIAITLMGVGMLAAGGGMALFGIGLTAVAAAGAAAVAVLIGAVRSILNFLPEIATKLGAFIVAFANAVTKAAPAVVRAITTVLLALLAAIDKLAPRIIATLMRLLALMLAAMIKYVPKMADAALQILNGILKALAKNVGKLVTSGTDVVVNFLKGVGNNLPRVIQAGVELILKFINGVADAIRNNSGAMGEAGANLGSAVVEGMIRGLAGGAGRVASKAKELAVGAWEAAKRALDSHSPSKKFIGLGEDSGAGLAIGLVNYTKVAAKAAEGMGNESIEALRKSMSGISDILTTDANFNPVIRPVLDLTDVKRDATQIGSALSASIKPSTSSAKAKDASAGYQANQVARQEVEVGSTTKFEYTQINNSPKALSNAEIYRQTNNQLSTVKGALKNAN